MKEEFKSNKEVSQETMDRHFALSLKHNDEFFEQFIQMGADVNLNYGQTLIMAVKDNDLVRMELLLEHGADPTLLRKYALKFAVKNQNLEALELMYKYRQNMKDNEIEPDYYEFNRMTWIDKEIFYSSFNEVIIGTNNLKLVQKLLPEINDEENPSYNKNLRFAIKTANLEMVKLVFVPQKIDADLMKDALYTNSREIIEFMVSQCNGKFPEYTLNDDGLVTIQNLGARGCCETLKYIIDMPSEARNLSEAMWNNLLDYAFESAIEGRQLQTIKLLVSYASTIHVDVEKMFKKREIQQDDVFSVVELLIKNSIIESYEGIAKEAAKHGRTDILELLERHKVSYDLMKVLNFAVSFKSLNAIEYLLAKEEVVLTREDVKELLAYGKFNKENYEIVKMLMMKEEDSSLTK